MPAVKQEWDYQLPSSCRNSEGYLVVSDDSVRLALTDFFETVAQIDKKHAKPYQALVDKVLSAEEGVLTLAQRTKLSSKMEVSELRTLLVEYQNAIIRGCQTCAHCVVEQVGDTSSDDYYSCGLFESVDGKFGQGSDLITHNQFRVYSRDQSPRVKKHFAKPCDKYQNRFSVTMTLKDVVASLVVQADCKSL